MKKIFPVVSFLLLFLFVASTAVKAEGYEAFPGVIVEAERPSDGSLLREHSSCSYYQQDVEMAIAEMDGKGNARWELVMRRAYYEDAINLIEGEICQKEMKKYKKILPRLKKEKAKIDKLFDCKSKATQPN